MNREQRRNYTKKLKKKGCSKETIDFLIKYKELELSQKEEFNEGDKVKLNYEQLTMHPNYIKNKTNKEPYVVKHREFIENNKDKELTVEYDDRFKDKKEFMSIKEDINDPKLLFHRVDLIKITESITN